MRNIIRNSLTVLLVLLLVCAGIIPSYSQTQYDDEMVIRLKKDVYYLADDKLAGRLTGTKGAKLAAKYISKRYNDLDLEPFIGKRYTQKFKYKFNPDPHRSSDTKSKQLTGNNIIAYLNNNAKKTILIGAHYDHLGSNEHHNSTDPNSSGVIHNGADDNASGVAVLLEIARRLSQNGITENANYIFACFSGEEDGLMGSKFLAKYIRENALQLDVMINMDMLGRLNDHKSLLIGGVGTSPAFVNLINSLKPSDFVFTLDSSGIGPTDHASFYLQEYPVLSFFTGSHSDYHKPTDDADKINYEGMGEITALINTVLQHLENETSYPFTKTKATESKKMPKYKVTLGVMPDYMDYGDGLHIDAVTEGRPADLAGLQEGDVIMKIDDCEIKEVYSYMGCLERFQKGDKTIITYKRGSEILQTQLTF